MRTVKAKEECIIQIGRTSENDAEVIRFDVSDWPELYGAGGSFVLAHQRPNEAQPYVCAASVAADGWLEWIVKDTDVQITGKGEAQLTYVINSVVAKSVIFTTRISRSLGQTGELPEPYENMIDELIETAANITTEANRAVTAKEAAETAQGKAEDARDAAQLAQGKAEDAEESAESHKDDAEAAATLARSWAEGGTGTRQGENTDNAEYWAGVAQQGAETAGYALFEVDNSDGCMYVTTAGHIGEDVDFEVNEEAGILEVIYT